MSEYDNKLIGSADLTAFEEFCLTQVDISMELMDDEEKFEIALREVYDSDDVPQGTELDDLVREILYNEYLSGGWKHDA
jgi:hypothetical protein